MLRKLVDIILTISKWITFLQSSSSDAFKCSGHGSCFVTKYICKIEQPQTGCNWFNHTHQYFSFIPSSSCQSALTVNGDTWKPLALTHYDTWKSQEDQKLLRSFFKIAVTIEHHQCIAGPKPPCNAKTRERWLNDTERRHVCSCWIYMQAEACNVSDKSCGCKFGIVMITFSTLVISNIVPKLSERTIEPLFADIVPAAAPSYDSKSFKIGDHFELYKTSSESSSDQRFTFNIGEIVPGKSFGKMHLWEESHLKLPVTQWQAADCCTLTVYVHACHFEKKLVPTFRTESNCQSALILYRYVHPSVPWCYRSHMCFFNNSFN